MTKINWYNGKTANSASDMQKLCDAINRSLSVPVSAPAETKVVAVDTTNNQKMLTIGDGLSIENDTLKASGGTGTKKYFHQISLLNLPNDSIFYFNLVTTTPVFNYGPDAFNEVPDNYFISYSPSLPLTNTDTLGYLTIGARKQSDQLEVVRVDLVTRKMESSFLSMESLDLLEDNSVEL